MANETAVVEEEKGTEEVEEKEVDVETLSDEDLNKTINEQTQSGEEEGFEEKLGEEKKTTAKEQLTDSEKEKERDYKALYEEEKERNEKQGKAYRIQSNEVGDLRKDLEGKVAAGNKKNYELALEEQGAFEAQKKLNEANYAEQQLRDLEIQETVRTNKADVLQSVPEFESKIEGISNYLSEQGVDPKNIADFKAQPFLEHPMTLRNLAKIVDLNSKTSELAKENELLRKKPSKLLDDIEKVAGEDRPITPTSGTSSQDNSVHLSEVDITNISDADLDKQLIESRGG